MKNFIKKLVLLFMVTSFLSCDKEGDIVFAPDDGTLFYYQGSSSLFRDYQLLYPYVNNKYLDPSKAIFPAEDFNLLDDNHLEVKIKIANTDETSWVITNKIPIYYDEYGIYDESPESKFSGLLRCLHPISDYYSFLLALNHESNTAIIYFIYQNLRLDFEYEFKSSVFGHEVVIEGIDLGMGIERWTIFGDPYYPREIRPRKLVHWERKNQNGSLIKEYEVFRYVDNKRLH